MNFERTWGVQFCRVIHNDNQLPEFEMTPDIVEIEAFPTFHPFWRGARMEHEEECKKKKQKKPREKTDSRSRGSGRGGRGRGRGKPSFDVETEPLPIQGGGRAARMRAAALAEIHEDRVPSLDNIGFASEAGDSEDDAASAVDALAESGSELSGSQDSGTDHEKDQDSDSVQTESVQSAFGVDDLLNLDGMAELSTGDPNAGGLEPDMEAQPAQVAEPDQPAQAVVEPAQPVDPAQAADKKRRVDLAVPRAKGEATERILVEMFGDIRFNSKGYMRAVCYQHEPIGSCMRQRTCRSAVPGRGRPIGQLTAWLVAGEKYATSKEHIQSAVSSHQDRIAARKLFYNLPGGHFFAQEFEAEKERGDDDEPKNAR